MKAVYLSGSTRSCPISGVPISAMGLLKKARCSQTVASATSSAFGPGEVFSSRGALF